MEDETMERVYDSQEEYYVLRPKINTKPRTEAKVNNKDIIKTKPISNPKTKTKDSIYSGMEYECTECHAEFRNKIALTTHSYSHNPKYLENTEYFNISSSQNIKEF